MGGTPPIGRRFTSPLPTDSHEEARPRREPLSTADAPRSRSRSPSASGEAVAGRRERSPLPRLPATSSTPLTPRAARRLDELLAAWSPFKSQREPHRQAIRAKLESLNLSDDRQMALLNGLNAEVTGRADLAAAIANWMARVNETTMVRPEQADTRSAKVKAAVQRLELAEQSEDFRDKVDQINGLFDLQDRRTLAMRSRRFDGRWQSALFRKFMDHPEVVADPQGGALRLATALHETLAASPLLTRVTVLDAWVPPAPAQEVMQTEPASAPAPATGRDFNIIYYRNFGTRHDEWRGSWSTATSGRVEASSFQHLEAEGSHDDEQALAVNAIHVHKQIGGEGHASIFVETAPDARMIKIDSVKKGYRVYVDARPDVGYDTERFDVMTSGGKPMTVKDVYDAMSKVTSGLGAWEDNDRRNCHGFVNSMLDHLAPRLSAPTRPTGRVRKPVNRYDPANPD
jgi:hypothetical protein